MILDRLPLNLALMARRTVPIFQVKGFFAVVLSKWKGREGEKHQQQTRETTFGGQL